MAASRELEVQGLGRALLERISQIILALKPTRMIKKIRSQKTML
jgi:hypothetical protein